MCAKLLYLDDANKTEEEATIVGGGFDERGPYFTLDKTIFHPQGGGQPCDKGKIEVNDISFNVIDVRYSDHDVHHYYEIRSDGSKPPVGKAAKLLVDVDNRFNARKAHTAGHLLQAVIESMGIGLEAIKGYHFPEGSYVQFIGEKPENIEQVIIEATDKINALIKGGSPVTAHTVSGSKLKELCPNFSGVPPDGKPVRVVKIVQCEKNVPCGGTHLDNISQLTKVTITKIKPKSNDVRISYNFE